MKMPPLPEFERVDDPLAEEVTPYIAADGSQRVFKVVLGKPVKHWSGPSAEIWFCPVYFEHEERGVKCIKGTGPVSALANAGVWVNATFQRVVIDKNLSSGESSSPK